MPETPETMQRAKTIAITNCHDPPTDILPDSDEDLTCSTRQARKDCFCNAGKRASLQQQDSVPRLSPDRGQQNCASVPEEVAISLPSGATSVLRCAFSFLSIRDLQVAEQNSNWGHLSHGIHTVRRCRSVLASVKSSSWRRLSKQS